MPRTLLLWCVVLLSLSTQAATLGSGSYADVLPPGAKGPSRLDGAPALPKRTSSLTGPMPSNDWWSSLGWQRYPENPYSENLYAHPLSLHARANGLGVGYPTMATITSGMPAFLGEYHFNHAEDLLLGVDGLNSPDTRVAGFSAWMVTASWTSGANTLQATFGHGSPFVYATRTGGDALVTFTAPPTVKSNQAGVAVATVNGHVWGVYGPSGCAWTVQGNTLRSTLCGKDYFSVAVLPDETASTQQLFLAAAYAFVTNTAVTWTYDAASARLTSRFEATVTAKEPSGTTTLLALYPHQWKNTTATTTALTYGSPRGVMKLVSGNSFSVATRFDGVLPGLPTLGTSDPAVLRPLVIAVANDPNFQLTGGAGTYWVGKSVERLAVLVRVAEQLGEIAARDQLLATIKTTLETWFTASAGKTAKLFAYEPTWGTLIGFPAEYGSDQELNDHHFHVGYFIYAAATVAQYDPAWAADSSWGGMVNLLIRDANSPRVDDPLFPFLRCFDPYAGHGWASGHAGFGAGNNQESSSEGMNFSQAVVLWGAATGNDTMRDLGIFLYANEAEVIRAGWFDADGSVFPAGFAHHTAGIVWGDGASYSTWFSAEPAKIHGINFLPITGGSLYLATRPEALRQNLAELSTNTGGAANLAWPDVLWETQALLDPAAALARFNAAGSYTGEDGETRAHTYHWLHALDALGQVDPTVSGNVPTSAVFTKAAKKTYVAWNPAATGVTVTFSDGAHLAVAGHAFVAGDGTDVGPAPDAGSPGGGAGGSGGTGGGDGTGGGNEGTGGGSAGGTGGGLAATADGGTGLTASQGCGCGAVDGPAGLLAAALLLVRRRRSAPGLE